LDEGERNWVISKKKVGEKYGEKHSIGVVEQKTEIAKKMKILTF